MFLDSFVGLASLAVSIAGFINPHDVPNANIRVHLQSGQNGQSGLEAADGHLPSITLKDTSNRLLGGFYQDYYNSKKLGSDMYWNYDIKSQIPSELRSLELKMESFRDRGPVWGNELHSLDDALCLAYMSWSPEDSMFNYDARMGGVSGDLFYLCGHSWHYSGKQRKGYHLRCGWLDGDDSTGNSVHGVFINTDVMAKNNIEAFVRNNPDKSLCHWGVTFYKNASPHKRAPTKDVYGKKAYVTAGEGAIALCDSPTSWGISMLSLKEGIFCDMVTKTKVPICNRRKKEGCFNYNRRLNKAGRAIQRSLTLAMPTTNSTLSLMAALDISHESYELEYFVISDVNGTIIDDGTGI
ncbi:hypothetical protein BGZ51_009321 [Haplosporangium sp. Z 767]|nr:hypothetical protein BGZ50_009401 [Haplosporangium sp. Z 11]KAF9177000.1 hypothetical protein BGZ51_009321 [Haplosporangium sp. Z 767]